MGLGRKAPHSPPGSAWFCREGSLPTDPIQPRGAQPSRVTAGTALAAGTKGWGVRPQQEPLLWFEMKKQVTEGK